ncbi:MAG: hypothetical protein RLN75_00185, partial [Longimicrobiales bacterium]
MTAPSGSLASPPAPAGPPSTPSGGDRGPSDREPPGQVQPWSRRHPGRVRAVAFIASAVVHLLALLLYPAITVRFGEFDPAGETAGPVEVEGMEVVNLQEAAEDDLEAPTAPEDALVPEAVAPVVTLPAAPGEDLTPTVEVAPPAEGASAADRLRPATYEEELWMPLVPDAVALTEQELLRSVVYRRLQAFNDSMAILAARAAEGTDWTYTDEDGNRWGISPGKLHLGSITIPLPFSFGAPAGASDDLLDAMAIDREIQR